MNLFNAILMLPTVATTCSIIVHVVFSPLYRNWQILITYLNKYKLVLKVRCFGYRNSCLK